jgi:hypothetical protein
MSGRKGPPGWQPHQIATRIDGFVGNDPCRPPRVLAELIARNMPQLGEGNSAADVLARMITRQARHDRAMAHRRARVT